MAATGGGYTTALRAVTGRDGGGARSPIASALKPGTVTIAVCGGGMSNTALMLPEGLRLARAGHPLVIRPGQREGIIELPSLVDLAVVAGTLPLDQASAAANEDGLAVLLAAVAETQVAARHLDGAMGRTTLVSEIQQLQAEYAKPAIIWVQDVQVAGAVAIAGDAGPEVQVAALLDVAQQSGAIIAGGHCMPSEYEPGWENVAAAASEAFVIDWADDSLDPLDQPRDGVLIHVVGGIRTDTIPWRVDHRPFSWRYDYLQSRQAR
ncbi:MAG: hypothetical protein R2736_09835 [Solirubrobacterales bacterium]